MTMRPLPLFILVATSLSLVAPASARDLYVDNVHGLETNDGLAAKSDENNRGPFKTIHRGLRTAVPGDTVHLVPNAESYRESAVFHNRECPADQPITLDGHDASITGAEPVDLAEWELVEPGLYRKTKLLKHCDSAVIGRYFFRFDGKMQHMGRTSKGPSAKLKKPKDLQPGEWTFTATGDGTPKSPYVDDTFYVKLDPAKQPSDYKIEYPARSSGVQVSGRNTNIVIRNLNIRHVYNDGFNIHNYCRDVLFQDVSATECGDDGMSAHDDCRITVRGFRSIGNSTGFCHTNESWSDSENVYIDNCLGFDVFVLGTGKHRLANSRILSSANSSIVAMGPTKPEETGACTLELNGVACVRAARNKQIRLMARSIVHADECVFSGFHIACAAQELTLRNTRVASVAPKIAENEDDRDALKTITLDAATKFSGAKNVYDLAKITQGKLVVTRENYAQLGAELGDTGSKWQTLTDALPLNERALSPTGDSKSSENSPSPK